MKKIYMIDGIENTEGFDEKQFTESKRILRRIWEGKVSVPMSGIEYEEPSASWINQQVKKKVKKWEKHPLKWRVEVSTTKTKDGDFKMLQIIDSKGSVLLVINDYGNGLDYSYVEVSAKPVCELLVNALNNTQ